MISREINGDAEEAEPLMPNEDFVTYMYAIDPEEKIELLDKLIEKLLTARDELMGQRATPRTPPHKYPPVAAERLAHIMTKFSNLSDVVTHLSAAQFVGLRNVRIENSEAFIALREFARREQMEARYGKKI